MPLRVELPVPLLFELARPDVVAFEADPEAELLLRADGELAGLFVALLLEDFAEDFVDDVVPVVERLLLVRLPVVRLPLALRLPAPLLFVLLFEDDAFLVVPVPAEDFVELLPLRPPALPLLLDPPVADPLLLRVMLLPFAGAFPLDEEPDVEEELLVEEPLEAELFDPEPVDAEPLDAELPEAELLEAEPLEAELFDPPPRDADPLLPLLLPEARFGFSSTRPTFSPTVLAASPTKSATVEAVSEITSVTDS